MNQTIKYQKSILILSIAIPILVASLFTIKIEVELPVFLPPVYATLNGLTAGLLVVAFWAIKNKKIGLHEVLMKTAIVLSVLFLLMYITYHITSTSTKYGGDGVWRTVYFVVLISHILLSIVLIPFILITLVRAVTNSIELHKKIARITLPLWLYVALSGVFVYLLISPYY